MVVQAQVMGIDGFITGDKRLITNFCQGLTSRHWTSHGPLWNWLHFTHLLMSLLPSFLLLTRTARTAPSASTKPYAPTLACAGMGRFSLSTSRLRMIWWTEPGIVNAGRPGETSTWISIVPASTPNSAVLCTLTSTHRLPERHMWPAG